MDSVFSVVVLHYSQSDIWKETIQSILSQDYPSIELIFSDDCSPGFDSKAVEEFIVSNRKENLIRYKVSSQVSNVGTVENLRRAHAFCTGVYLTHIAADDVYISPAVLSRYAKCLEEKPNDVLGVYGQSQLCNKQLVQLGVPYIATQKAIELNAMTSIDQFFELSLKCCIPMGATAFFRDEYMQHEVAGNYKLIEDWPFFVQATRAGKRFLFGEFDALLYRDGGVSRDLRPSPTRIQCFKDTLHLFEYDIFPYISLCSLHQQVQIYLRYNQTRIEITDQAGELASKSRLELLCRNWKLMLFLLLNRIKSAKWISLCVFCWLWGAIALLTIGSAIKYQAYLLVGVFCIYSLLNFIKAMRRIIIFLVSKRG